MHPKQKQLATFRSLATLGSSACLGGQELAAATAFVSALYGAHGAQYLN
jgi:hypothetical protein